MVERIIKEKISADHLLYVSLKYTKTCDVILNLINRWTIMLDNAFLGMLEKLKAKKKIKTIPIAPRQRVEIIKKEFKNVKQVIDAIELYEFFKKIPNLRTIREFEFRKDVRLKIIEGNNEKIINLETLKSYSEKLESFISYVKQFLLSK